MRSSKSCCQQSLICNAPSMNSLWPKILRTELMKFMRADWPIWGAKLTKWTPRGEKFTKTGRSSNITKNHNTFNSRMLTTSCVMNLGAKNRSIRTWSKRSMPVMSLVKESEWRMQGEPVVGQLAEAIMSWTTTRCIISTTAILVEAVAVIIKRGIVVLMLEKIAHKSISTSPKVP